MLHLRASPWLSDATHSGGVPAACNRCAVHAQWRPGVSAYGALAVYGRACCAGAATLHACKTDTCALVQLCSRARLLGGIWRAGGLVRGICGVGHVPLRYGSAAGASALACEGGTEALALLVREPVSRFTLFAACWPDTRRLWR